ncbi:hypothetical protein SIO17_07420 [Pseudoalteromonas piscicida]|uniref:Uncharacterized protein n=1 Tax=Pseudoalteromonas piscicida TaxID=43662 RepID=A0ABN5CDC0_PSEO7|nr:hypothetical protein [Pseudoalteromonas piscicida]ATD06860.1 hypothetical protein PPIS_a1782 [Pseudoalteromonas piscicida]ATD06863.1 hypothetical protein PPIS_a1785 [Pseudoalteromonas piscicida]WPU33546.1 hypothetical protein SIO17_07410 [Pseudoalteromonas piscicida]WPU33548.1 hypothetical protein SIO17_07420 [Pseudoalteromonas piscicida]
MGGVTQEIKEQEIRKLLEKIIQSEINKTEDLEKKIVLENGAEIDMTDVVKIDSHPNFSEKRA